MSIIVPAAERWDAIYYPNPVPLSSRTLLALALLFDRVHFPGVSLPPGKYSDDDRQQVLMLAPSDSDELAFQNLSLWTIEHAPLADFIFFPDQETAGSRIESLEHVANRLLDDTVGRGPSGRVIVLNSAQMLHVPGGTSRGLALTWPFYQARALQYAVETGLPLLSDDPACVPPWRFRLSCG